MYTWEPCVGFSIYNFPVEVFPLLGVSPLLTFHSPSQPASRYAYWTTIKCRVRTLASPTQRKAVQGGRWQEKWRITRDLTRFLFSLSFLSWCCGLRSDAYFVTSPLTSQRLSPFFRFFLLPATEHTQASVWVEWHYKTRHESAYGTDATKKNLTAHEFPVL